MTRRQSHESPINSIDLQSKLSKSMSALHVSRLLRDLEEKQCQTKYEQIRETHALLEREHPGNVSIRSLAKIFSMAPSHVHSIISGKRIAIAPYPRFRLLSETEEETLTQFLTQQFHIGKPVLRINLIPTIFHLTGKNVGKHYVHCFLRRHCEKLVTQIALPLEKVRGELKKEDIEIYQKLLTEHVSGKPNWLIYNLDECGLSTAVGAKRQKVVIPRDKAGQPVHIAFEREPSNTTVMPCICLDGSTMTPLVVLKRKTLDLDVFTPSCREHIDVFIEHSERGYSTQEIFLKWLREMFFPQLHIRRTQLSSTDLEAIILADRATIHISPEITSCCEANGVRMIYFPPHSSHVYQPLDLLTFSCLKRELRRMKSEDPTPGAQARKIHRIIDALQIATIPRRVINAFARTGFTFDHRQFPWKAICERSQTDERVTPFLSLPPPLP